MFRNLYSSMLPNVFFTGFKSSLLMIALLFAAALPAAYAHETRPAIGDLVIDDKEMVLSVDVNLEAFVAGVNLSEVEDTNLTEQAADYDSLRALAPDEMEQKFRAFWPQMQSGFKIMAGETKIIPTLDRVEISDEPNLELLRDSKLTLRAELPSDDTSVTIGWERKFGPLVLRQQEGGPEAYTAFLRDGEISAAIPRSGGVDESAWSVFKRYIVAGFEHILPLGLDHILFVLGLFFLSPKLKPLLLQVTTFTLAHTLTLALGILGIINIAPEIVEPLIAASIVYVAVENLITSEMKPWRLIVVLLFGLLHGLGFASVLGEFGLDGSRFVTSLIGFNIGVELGQLTVIAMAYLAVGLWFSHKPFYRTYISNPASIIIGLVGAYWFVERVFL
ncbi:HupE/UreJ family protein [Ahrensia sp. 13_GOM-1096m]|uniref:HupE/UreJ family protein n=1 Tax=Ahrensia sp. 13_GOM-1096m TaxID=1380380 RepID=UPI0009E0572D|nr:HupE/UreJ family protein [Ahrensia sp. 13_GOM-1096m]